MKYRDKYFISVVSVYFVNMVIYYIEEQCLKMGY